MNYLCCPTRSLSTSEIGSDQCFSSKQSSAFKTLNIGTDVKTNKIIHVKWYFLAAIKRVSHLHRSYLLIIPSCCVDTGVRIALLPNYGFLFNYIIFYDLFRTFFLMSFTQLSYITLKSTISQWIDHFESISFPHTCIIHKRVKPKTCLVGLLLLRCTG